MPRVQNDRVYLPLKDRIKDGRVFKTNRRLPSGLVYLQCATPFCAGTGKRMPGRNAQIIQLRPHSAICLADMNAQMKADFRDALKSALKRNFWKLKQVYETVVMLFPREIKVLIPYNAIKDSLKRWRRQMYPPCPETLESMAVQLRLPESLRLLEYDVGRLSTTSVIDDDGQTHLVMYDEQFVATNFTDVSGIFVDATFETTPRVAGVYQLLTVLGVKFDHALPFMYALMSNKTQCAYIAVLTAVKNLLMSARSVRVIMTDFEQALRNACRTVFEYAHVTGCNVHYDRALLRKIKSMHLMPLIRDDEEAKLFLKKVMALAYLPAEIIQDEYTAIKDALPPPLKRSFSRFLIYYERQWLRVVKPNGFSVFGLSRRTNNVTESYNSILADKLGLHPNAWEFLGKLVKLTANARDDLRSLILSKRIKRHPRYSTIYKQKELINAWKQLHGNQITTAEFILRAAALKGRISQRLLQIYNEEFADDDDTYEAPDNNYLDDDPDYERDLFEDLPGADFLMDNANVRAESPNHDESGTDDSEVSLALRDIDIEAQNIMPDINDASVDLNLSEDERRFVPSAVDLEIRNLDPMDIEVGDALSEDERRFVPSPVDSEIRNLDPIDMQIGDAGNELEIQHDLIPAFGDVHSINNEGSTSEVADNGNNTHSGPPAAAGPPTNGKVSASRKKNLRRKRRRQLKSQRGEAMPVRPYGHKRRPVKKT